MKTAPMKAHGIRLSDSTVARVQFLAKANKRQWTEQARLLIEDGLMAHIVARLKTTQPERSRK